MRNGMDPGFGKSPNTVGIIPTHSLPIAPARKGKSGTAALHLAVGQKKVPHMEPWQVETWTKPVVWWFNFDPYPFVRGQGTEGVIFASGSLALSSPNQRTQKWGPPLGDSWKNG